MKIAYLLKEDIAKESGVVQKIRDQIVSWKQPGHDVKVFSVNSTGSISVIKDGVLFENPGHNPIQKISIMELNAKKCFELLLEYKPDLIYTRSLIYTPSIIRILTAFPTVMEINSDDMEERYLSGSLLGLYNKLTRAFILNSVNGLVFVTGELQQNLHFSRFRKKSVVVSNGAKLWLKPEVEIKCSEPTCVFIGTPNNPWHGVDKILWLATQLSDVKFRIIGYTKEQLRALNPDWVIHPNIQPYGYLDAETSRKVISESHVGIASLSLHINKMEEACPLKVRQYVACGLPIILGYYDTDLSKEPSPYILQLDSTEDNVNRSVTKICDFIQRCYHYSPTDVRKSLFPLVDVERKEQLRLAFLKEVLSEQTTASGKIIQ